MKKIYLTLIKVMLFGMAFSQVPTNGLVAYYPFDGNANDASGNNLNGTVQSGISTTTGRNNLILSALSFPGGSGNFNGGGVLIPTNSLLNFTSSYSFSIWTYYAANNSYDYVMLFSKGRDVNNSYVMSYKPSVNMLTFFHNNGNGTIYMTTGTSDIKNKWVNISGTMDVASKSASLYVNGDLLSTVTFSSMSLVSNITNGLSIGWHQGDAGIRYPFNGKIDDVRFYNRALSQSEISPIYNENKCYQTISVTDTLRISRLTGYNSIPQDFGTLKLYPNPTKDILNISISDPSANYSIKILNNSGTSVFTSNLGNANQQVNLNNLGTNGLYLIQILDSQNKIIDVRKLILE